MRASIIYSAADLEKNRFFWETVQELWAQAGVDCQIETAEGRWAWLEAAGCGPAQAPLEGLPPELGLSLGLPLDLLGPQPLRAQLDFVLNRSRDAALAARYEQAGIPVFNNSLVAELGNDKWAWYRYAQALELPVLETELLSVEPPQLPYPLVAKSRRGHGGQELRWLEDEAGRQDLLAELRLGGGSASDWIVQRPAARLGRDWRVYILGGRPYAAVLREAPSGDWRANYSLGARVSWAEFTAELASPVERLCQALSIDYGALDFLDDGPGGPVVHELEDCCGARLLYQLDPSTKIISDYARLILGRFGLTVP